MSLDQSRMKDMGGFFEGDRSAISAETFSLVSHYKKRVSGGFSPINLGQIEEKLAGSDFCVTRKYDGELILVFFEKETAYGVGSGGTCRQGLPCLDELAAAFKSCGTDNAILAAELYVDESNDRTRVYDVSTALAKGGDRDALRLAVFDIVQLDGQPVRAAHYRETHARLVDILSNCSKAHPVMMTEASSRQGVLEIAQKWVEQEGAEGVIVHSENPRIFKIKPKHTFDAVVVGYAEGDGEGKGKIRSVLFALRHTDGTYQVIASSGNGFSDEDKVELFNKLGGMHVDSQYLQTDSRNIAYHMVKPEVVVEISANDLLTETSKGAIQNSLLTFAEGYLVQSMMPGVSLIHPVIERIRSDKSADVELVNIRQITDLIQLTDTQESISQPSAPAEMISREVYVKESKGQKMIQKFLVWQTNKSSNQNFPAYVMHYTNFSPSRKEMMKRDVRVSSSREQIFEIKARFVEENVKKGWEIS